MEFTDMNSKIKQHTCGELINRSHRDTYLQVRYLKMFRAVNNS